MKIDDLIWETIIYNDFLTPNKATMNVPLQKSETGGNILIGFGIYFLN